jgi:hypothetical protein
MKSWKFFGIFCNWTTADSDKMPRRRRKATAAHTVTGRDRASPWTHSRSRRWLRSGAREAMTRPAHVRISIGWLASSARDGWGRSSDVCGDDRSCTAPTGCRDLVQSRPSATAQTRARTHARRPWLTPSCCQSVPVFASALASLAVDLLLDMPTYGLPLWPWPSSAAYVVVDLCAVFFWEPVELKKANFV